MDTKAKNTRSKACKACSRAKRRCDLMYPSCSRCVTKRTLCEYNAPTELQLAMVSAQLDSANTFMTSELDRAILDSVSFHTDKDGAAELREQRIVPALDDSLSAARPTIRSTSTRINVTDQDTQLSDVLSDFWGPSTDSNPTTSVALTFSSPSSDESGSSGTSYDESPGDQNQSKGLTHELGRIQEVGAHDKFSDTIENFEFTTLDLQDYEKEKQIYAMSRYERTGPFRRYAVYFDHSDFTLKESGLNVPVTLFCSREDYATNHKLPSTKARYAALDAMKTFVDPSQSLQRGIKYMLRHAQKFVHTRSNAFIHSKLFHEMPPVLSSALAICALAETFNNSRTERNDGINGSSAAGSIGSSFDPTLRTLILNHYKSFKFEKCHTTQEQLAWVQAATLLQITALYSPSISLSGIGEIMLPIVFGNMNVLSEALELLSPQYTVNFKTWVLAESGVRTLLWGFLCQNIYLMLKKSHGYMYSFMPKHLPCFVRRSCFQIDNEKEWRQEIESYHDFIHPIHDVPLALTSGQHDASIFCVDALCVVGVCMSFELLEKTMKCGISDDLLLAD